MAEFPDADQVYRNILAAAQRLGGVARRTPVITSRTLDERLGARIFFKCENLQNIGAFKFRGAYNALSQFSAAQRERGVITYSSGNHAQAMARAGALLGIDVIVVMPENAPATKLAATRGYGATVVTYNPQTEQREAVAAALPEARGRTLVPPFDHDDVIAGQGTAAMELLEECGSLDLLLIPTGGGGLLAGSAVAARGMGGHCKVMGVEPELADDATRSFRTGHLQTVINPPTIADGVRTTSLGQRNFALIRQCVHDMATVSERDIMAAVRDALLRLKLVVEPAGALGLAALLSGAVKALPRTGIILSGGNIDVATLVTILSAQNGD